MDGTFVKELAVQIAKPQVVGINGEQHLLVPKETGYVLDDSLETPEHLPGALVFGSLAGLADYLIHNRDTLELTRLIATATFADVSVFGPVSGWFAQRPTYARADLRLFVDEHPFVFGRFYDQEAFVIALQCAFVPDAALSAVLRVVGQVRDESVRQLDDDGVTQTVTARTGAVLRADVPLPNPVFLKPWRTFREVDQPGSTFVLRARAGGEDQTPMFALFLADGESWKLTAAERVAEWLRAHLPPTVPVLT